MGKDYYARSETDFIAACLGGTWLDPGFLFGSQANINS
jgi:hypothetical protein